MGWVFSRVNTNRRSMLPHSKHSRVWCSKPGTGMVSSCTTCVTCISAAHISIALQLLPFNAACVVPIPRAFRLRTFKRQWPRGKPLHPCLMLNSAVRTSKSHQVGPDAGQGRVIDVKLKVDWLSGLRAPSNEIAHRVARNCQEKEGDFLTAFLLLGRLNRVS